MLLLDGKLSLVPSSEDLEVSSSCFSNVLLELTIYRRYLISEPGPVSDALDNTHNRKEADDQIGIWAMYG
jgi:hypothetical protein